MADIFLSYTHEDELRAKPVVELLESQGWTVWWDRGIEPGMPWRPELDIELANCRAVIVLWSHTSINSEWVCREARAGHHDDVVAPERGNQALLDIGEEHLSSHGTFDHHWGGHLLWRRKCERL